MSINEIENPNEGRKRQSIIEAYITNYEVNKNEDYDKEDDRLRRGILGL